MIQFYMKQIDKNLKLLALLWSSVEKEKRSSGYGRKTKFTKAT